MPAFWLSKEGLPALNGNATMPEAMLALAPPSVRLWAEVSVAVAIGCLCCLALAGATFYRRSREKHPLTMMMLVLWTFVLCLPFFLPMRFGLSASTVAILNFIGSWKAVDCFMGTQPTALTSNGFFPGSTGPMRPAARSTAVSFASAFHGCSATLRRAESVSSWQGHFPSE